MEKMIQENQEGEIAIKEMPDKKISISDSTAVPEKGSVSFTGLPDSNENKSDTVTSTGIIPDKVKLQVEAEKKISGNVMSICLTSDGIIIKDEEKEGPEDLGGKLSGVYCEGVQYYDLSGITYINNTGMAILIDLLKALLEMGVEVEFVNVHESIKKKIREVGLERIINYGEKSGS